MRNYLVEDVLGPNAMRLFWLQHLKRNFHVRFGEKLVGYFRSIARSTSEQSYHWSVDRLQHTLPLLVMWLQLIPVCGSVP